MEKIIEKLTDFRYAIARINGSDDETAEKKAENASQEFRSTPTSGVIDKVDFEVYGFENNAIVPLKNEAYEAARKLVEKCVNEKKDFPTNLRVSIGWRLQDKQFLSESAVSASTVTEELMICKSVKNSGSFMLKQERVSPQYYALGVSSNERYTKMVGKRFNATAVPGRAVIDYKKMFSRKSDKEQVKADLLANTDTKTYYCFEF